MRRQGNISCSSKYDGACIARGVLTLDSRVTTPVGQMLNPPGYRHDINLSYGGGARGRHLSSTVRRTARSSVMGGSGRHGCGQAHTARPSRAAVRTIVMCSRSICSRVPRDSSHSLAAAAAAATAFHRVEVAISLLAPDSTRPSVRPT